MFQTQFASIIRSNLQTVVAAHGIYSTPHLWYTPVAATTVCKLLLMMDANCVWNMESYKNQINRKSCISLVFFKKTSKKLEVKPKLLKWICKVLTETRRSVSLQLINNVNVTLELYIDGKIYINTVFPGP